MRRSFVCIPNPFFFVLRKSIFILLGLLAYHMCSSVLVVEEDEEVNDKGVAELQSSSADSMPFLYFYAKSK